MMKFIRFIFRINKSSKIHCYNTFNTDNICIPSTHMKLETIKENEVVDNHISNTHQNIWINPS